LTAIDSKSPGHDHAGAHTAGHAPAHGQYPFLAHHFETPAQQFDSAKLGMWLFLVTEVLFFGALFAMYAIMRYREPEVFSFASHYLSTNMGAVNTGVLILSSLTMAMGVHFAQRGKKGPLVTCLILTLLGAVGFLVIKFFEYDHKIRANLVWGPGFYEPVKDANGNIIGAPSAHADAAQPPAAVASAMPAVRIDPLIGKALPGEASVVRPSARGPAGIAPAAAVDATAAMQADGHVADGHGAEGEHGAGGHDADKAHVFDPNLPKMTHRFFAIYYCMTGLHGIHVVIGMFLIGWLTIRAMRGEFTSNYYTPVDLVGLYWHIVDLIWIFLFPLFYLIH